MAVVAVLETFRSKSFWTFADGKFKWLPGFHQARNARTRQQPHSVSDCVKSIMRKTIVIFSLLVLALAGVVSLYVITRPPALRVGTTLEDPRSYFISQITENHRGIRRLMGRSICAAEQVISCRTQYRLRPNHPIAVQCCTYRFDTNKTLVSVSTEWKWLGDF